MKYKVIKSVAHNFGHSFVSLMNYRADDYVMSYLVRAALASGQAELRIDLTTGQASPQALLTPPVRESVASYVAWLPKLLQSHRVRPDAVISASMILHLALGRVSDDIGFKNHVEVPFECLVTLVDDRGREHIGRTTGWWSAHKGGPPPLTSTFGRSPNAKRAIGQGITARPWWKFWAQAA